LNDLALLGGHDLSRAVKAQSMRALAPAVPVLASWPAVIEVEGACPERSRRVSRLFRHVQIRSKVVFCAKDVSFSRSCHPERSEGPMYLGVEARGLGRDHDFEAALSEVYLYREPEPLRVK
jgi:hypothetical protein